MRAPRSTLDRPAQPRLVTDWPLLVVFMSALPLALIRWDDRTVGDDPALVQLDCSIQQGSQRTYLVQDDQHRCAGGYQLSQQVGQGLLGSQVDPGGRLVQHQQLRLAGQRSSDQDSLLLSAGERGHLGRRPVSQVDNGQRPRYRAAIASSEREEGFTAGQSTGGHHLLDLGSSQHGPRALWYVADPGPGSKAAQRSPEEAYLPALIGKQPDQRSDQCRLAGSIAAHQRHCLAPMHPKIDAAEDGKTTELDRHVVGADDVCALWRRPYGHPLAFRRAARLAAITVR